MNADEKTEIIAAVIFGVAVLLWDSLFNDEAENDE